MDNMQKEKEQGLGRLPAMAPLANPYVPFQLENPPKYEARKGLVRGTLYPGLELPFMGMVNRNELPVTPMSELQALAFAIQELALYLDTHREDTEALELYRRYQEMYQNGRNEYVKSNGPLNHGSITQGKQYEWLDDPWPEPCLFMTRNCNTQSKLRNPTRSWRGSSSHNMAALTENLGPVCVTFLNGILCPLMN